MPDPEELKDRILEHEIESEDALAAIVAFLDFIGNNKDELGEMEDAG